MLGAAFAACVMTSLPGFTLLLSNSGKSNPDLLAASAELVVGSIAAAFGALQIRAQTRSRGKWIGLLPLAALAFAVGAIGVAFVLDVGSGSVDSGPAILVGFFGVLVLVGVNVMLAAFAWFLLSLLVQALNRDEASGIDPSVTASKWLGVAAIIHVVLKCTTAGPSIFGFAAAVMAVSHALRSKQTVALLLGALSIAASVGTTLGARVYYARKYTLEQIPQCEQIIPSRIRDMPGVAQVMVYAPSPYGGPDLTVIVLPIGGGPVPLALKDSIAADVMSSGCVVDAVGTKPRVTVVDPKYTEFPVRIRAHLAPGANADDARKVLVAVTRDFYEPRAESDLLRDPQTAGNETPSTPQDAGVQFADWMTGSDDLGTRVDQLPIGAVVVPGKIDVEFVTDQ